MVTVLIAYLRNDSQGHTVKMRVPNESFAKKYEVYGWRLVGTRRVTIKPRNKRD